MPVTGYDAPSATGARDTAPPGLLRVGLAAARCLLRNVPLFLRARPRTPLRVLGIIALDTLHVVRRSTPLPRRRISDLALFLDFQGCANAVWDLKPVCLGEFRAVREQLEAAGLGTWIERYLERLRALEARRPTADATSFEEIRAYREAGVRLSLAAASGIAFPGADLDQQVQSSTRDADLDTLVRILLHCQVIDDVLDYRGDLASGLPSFLTACASLPEALTLTATAIRTPTSRRGSTTRALFPFRLALWLFTAAARLVVRTAQLCLRVAPPQESSPNDAQACESEEIQRNLTQRSPAAEDSTRGATHTPRS